MAVAGGNLIVLFLMGFIQAAGVRTGERMSRYGNRT
jgi:hypothetical protein